MHINITSPCSEKWENFTPSSGGRHCNSCAKVVIDFTQMTDAEIIQYFKQHKTGTCGRFHPQQLRAYSDTVQPKTGKWKFLKAALASGVLLLLSREGMSQNKDGEIGKTAVSTIQTETQNESKTETTHRVISGVVLAQEDGSGLPGVNIILKGTLNSTVSDADGRFRMENVHNGDVLVFSFIGLKNVERVITANAELRIEMQPDSIRLGEVALTGIVGGATATRTISFRRWWWQLKGVVKRLI